MNANTQLHLLHLGPSQHLLLSHQVQRIQEPNPQAAGPRPRGVRKPNLPGKPVRFVGLRVVCCVVLCCVVLCCVVLCCVVLCCVVLCCFVLGSKRCIPTSRPSTRAPLPPSHPHPQPQPPEPPKTHPNTDSAAAVASRSSPFGATAKNAAISAVTLQPVAVMEVRRGTPLETPMTRLPSVTCVVVGGVLGRWGVGVLGCWGVGVLGCWGVGVVG